MPTNVNTTNVAAAWRPDETLYAPADVVDEALILRASTVVTSTLDGDEPVARLAFVKDGDAKFVEESSEIDEAAPELSEAIIGMVKIGQVIRVSNELFSMGETAPQLSASMSRSVIGKANEAFVAQPVPTGFPPLTGIVNTPGVTNAGTITTNLDALADAVAEIEANAGAPSVILANPKAWGTLRKLKAADTSNTTLLGAGVEDQGKRLLGIDVLTDAAVPAGQLVVIDKNAIVSGVGPVHVAQSEHLYFKSDAMALRVTWRIGWAVQYPERIATVTVGEPAGD